ncbi:lytic transglycosylase domain-containing protein [Roseovarius sp.]|uniref:lytic transglycosylase domain-containing protein n=1 Tax=Roseovarius sp. TaxID=1486281 RepID=UPI003564316D
MPRIQMFTERHVAGLATFSGLTLAILYATPSAASYDPMTVCDLAAERAAQSSDVPSEVLKAITRTETGRAQDGRFGPWAWTVNMEGRGVWFDSPDAARAYVYKHFKRGARSFDVGCFQINYKWHHQEFSSIEEMFEPMANARYAARFLTELRLELGSWQKAVGAYHSRTPKHAQRYTKIYKQHLATMQSSKSETSAAGERTLAEPVRMNQYPLLRRGSGVETAGSLVKLNEARSRQMFPVSRPIWDGKP